MLQWYWDNFYQIWFWIFLVLSFKVAFIGGEFNIIYYIKYGKKYSKWYNNRESFIEYLNK